MKFCSECGSQMIHTETNHLCPCCGETRCSCAECNPVFNVEDCMYPNDDSFGLESGDNPESHVFDTG